MSAVQPRWLKASAAAAYLDMGLSTFYRMVAAKELPAPRRPRPNMPRWDRHELDRALAGKSETGLESRASDADAAFQKAANALAKTQNRPIHKS